MASVFCVLFKKFLLPCGHEDVSLWYLQEVLFSSPSHLRRSLQELGFVCCEVRVKVPFFPSVLFCASNSRLCWVRSTQAWELGFLCSQPSSTSNVPSEREHVIKHSGLSFTCKTKDLNEMFSDFLFKICMYVCIL